MRNVFVERFDSLLFSFRRADIGWRLFNLYHEWISPNELDEVMKL